jgi:CHAT domain-containing protein/Tfp pilus assembly protein PilF
VPIAFSVVTADGELRAGRYEVRVLAARPVSAVDLAWQRSRARRTAGARAEAASDFERAGVLLRTAMTVADATTGIEPLFLAGLALDLGGNALERHDDGAARAWYERALREFARATGASVPGGAMARSRLALVAERAGRYEEAERTLRGALDDLERSLGPHHPWYLRSLATLANLRDDAGDLDEAERLNRQALRLVEESHQSGTILEANLLNGLADLRRQRGDYVAAEALFLQSLAIGRSIRGPESLFAATAFQNLGVVAREQKDYSRATDYYTRALRIRERLEGPSHQDIAPLLNNLGNVYHATGEDQEAIEMYFQALRIWEATADPYHRGLLNAVGNLARTFASAGDVPQAIAFERRADAIIEGQLSLRLAVGSERQKLAFVRSIAERTDRTISLHLQQAPGNPDAASLAALVLLQRKGRVQDAMTDLLASVRQRLDAPDRVLLEELNQTLALLARISLLAPGQQEARQLSELEQWKEQLEAALSDHSAEFRAQLRPVTLADVQRALPDDASLLEFVVYRPFDPRAERNDDAYDLPHYAAYVIRRTGVPAGVDLGSARDIDAIVARLRTALRDPTRDAVAPARDLDRRILQPLRRLVNGSHRLLISPDGALNLVPFEALVDEDGHYLVERRAVTYVTSGRDLLRLQGRRRETAGAVIVADPLFGEPRGADRLVGAGAVPRATSLDRARREPSRYFAPLRGTAEEARAIHALVPEAVLLDGGRATKASLEALHAPRLLHIASHAYFLDDRGPQSVVNPLLRSGIALAGANVTPAAGILTALEASGLDLWGTQLVTLSACDTGTGEVRDGEGVYGLRRAFTLAGAEALVMSLWATTDTASRDIMTTFYERLHAGAGRGDALREAKLAILGRPHRRHPYYWAAFIQSGDWTPLAGR